MMYLNKILSDLLLFGSWMFEWLACMFFINSLVKRKVSKLRAALFFTVLFIIVAAVKFTSQVIIDDLGIVRFNTLILRITCTNVVLLSCFLFMKAVYNFTSHDVFSLVIPLLILSTTNVLHLLIKYLSAIIAPNYQFLFMLISIIEVDVLLLAALHFMHQPIKRQELIYYKKDVRMIMACFFTSLLILAFFNIFLLQLQYIRLNQLIPIILSVAAVIIMDIIVLKLLLRTANNNHMLKENEIKLIGQSLETQYARNIKEQNENIRRMRHDFKHHMCVIDALLDDNKVSQARAYLKDYLGSTAVNTYVDTGNEYLNAILNSKITYAKRSDIKITSVIAGEINGVDNIDLCNLLGNLLDNAIEGCENTEEKSVVVKIVADEQLLRISVSNTINSSVLKANPQLSTSKDDSTNHGFGTKSIKEIANRYNGYADYFEEDNRIFANITLIKQQ